MRIIVLISLLFISFLIYAQKQSIKYFSTETGLSQNEVTDVIQDSKGFMWCATRGGLNRYDGYNFIHFKSRGSNIQGLSNPSIECIYEDRNGRICIGTKSGGVDIYDPEFNFFLHFDNSKTSAVRLSSNRIISIYQSRDGTFLFGSQSNGLTIWNQKNDSVSYRFKNVKIRAIKEGLKGNVWLGTNNGLYRYNLEKDKIVHHNFGGEFFNINDILIDTARNKIWIAAWEKGLIEYNPSSKENIRHQVKTPDDLLKVNSLNSYSLLLDDGGNIFMGTWGGGLFKFDPETSHFENIAIKPKQVGELNKDFDIILKLFKAPSGDIWVGTDGGGICRISYQPLFRGISLNADQGSGLKNHHILTLLHSNENQLWVGTKGGGLYFSNNRRDFIPVLQNEEEEIEIDRYTIKHLFIEDQNQIWVGTNSGLHKIEKQNGKFNIVDFDPENIWWDMRKVTSILKSKTDFLVGTQQNGLFNITENKDGITEVNNLKPANSPLLKNRRITFIKKDNRSRIWIGTYAGICFYDVQNKSFQKFNIVGKEQLSSRIILCWNQFNDSTFFVGTPSGLTQLTETGSNTFQIKNYYRENGLADDYVHALLSDNNNSLWISTNQGISRFYPKKEFFRNYDESDGLQGKSFSEGCSFKNENGEMFFGGANGFNFFTPKNIVDNATIPRLVLTEFKIENKPIKTGEKIYKRKILNREISFTSAITLPYQVNEFSFTFAALCFDAPARNNYAYRLVDLNSNWIKDKNNNWNNIGNKRTVSFNKLKAGTYVFEVIGSNNHNVWNEDPLQLEIKVNPAPWKSWYAFLIYLIIIMVLILLIRWNAIKQVRLANSLELEKVKNEQEHELNEMKLRFFTNISHEFRTPLTLILGPIKEMLEKNTNNRKMQVIYKNAQRLLQLVNQLLEFRKTETDTLRLNASENNIIEFVKELSSSFEELASINNILLKKQLAIKEKTIWFDTQKLEMVLTNLISNSFKYAGNEKEVNLTLSETKKTVKIHVYDNGPGIQKKDITHIFERFYQASHRNNFGSSGIGLNLAKKLVELHSGSISVTSVPNEKTEFIVELPKGSTHLTKNQKVDHYFRTKTDSLKLNLGSKLVVPKEIKKSSQTGKSILIIEDNKEIREYLEELFEDNYLVITAKDGAEGYKCAKEKILEIIISDVLMPKMDGFELCKNLKTNFRTSHIPVILLTAKSASQFRIEGIKHGADAYISKPFNPDELKIQVESLILSRKKLREKFSKIIKLEPSQLEISSFEEKFIGKILKAIDKNINNSEFGAENLASVVGMSTSTLYRKLKSVAGQTSNEFIRSIRLKRAAQLLSDQSKSISEIAYQVGFNDVKYFRKCFQKQYESTPSDFRKNLTN